MAWTPDQAALALEGVTAPWAVAGGWALDLWLGEQTREHGDLEIALPSVFFGEIQARLEGLGLEFFAIDDGQVIALAPGEAPARRTHQTWVMDPAVNGWRMDIFREPGDARTWIYRRTGDLAAPEPGPAAAARPASPMSPRRSSCCSRPRRHGTRTRRISPSPRRGCRPRPGTGWPPPCAPPSPATPGSTASQADGPIRAARLNTSRVTVPPDQTSSSTSPMGSKPFFSATRREARLSASMWASKRSISARAPAA